MRIALARCAEPQPPFPRAFHEGPDPSPSLVETSGATALSQPQRVLPADEGHRAADVHAHGDPPSYRCASAAPRPRPPLSRRPLGRTMFHHGVRGGHEHAVVTVLPPDQIRRCSALPVNLGDHALASSSPTWRPLAMISSPTSACIAISSFWFAATRRPACVPGGGAHAPVPLR